MRKLAREVLAASFIVRRWESGGLDQGSVIPGCESPRERTSNKSDTLWSGTEKREFGFGSEILGIRET